MSGRKSVWESDSQADLQPSLFSAVFDVQCLGWRNPAKLSKNAFCESGHLDTAARNSIREKARCVWNAAVACQVIPGRSDTERAKEFANRSLSLCFLPPLDGQRCFDRTVSRTKAEAALAVRREYMEESVAVRGGK